MNSSRRIFVALLLATCLGCGETGPKQTLVFRATPLPGASGPIDLDTTARMVKARIAGTKIRKRTKVEQSSSGIDVIVYGATTEEVEKIKSYVTDSFTLEFAATAHREINADLVALANDVEREVVVDGEPRAAWLPVTTKPDGTPKDDDSRQPEVISRERENNGKVVPEWLVVYEPGLRITGDSLKSATADIDETGRPCLSFVMNAEGSENLFALTSELIPHGKQVRRLAIIFNGRIHSAPVVQSAISSRGQITGDFTQREVDQTAMMLQIGKFPCQRTFTELIDAEAKK